MPSLEPVTISNTNHHVTEVGRVVQVSELHNRYDLLEAFSQTNACMDELYKKVQNQIVLCCYINKTANILIRVIFLFGMQD